MPTQTLEDAFRALCDEFGVSLDETHSSADEDAQAYLDPEDPDYVLEPFVLVTRAGEFTYLKCYRAFSAAIGDAFENVDDDIYAELPIAIVKLEDDTRWLPDYEQTPWKPAGQE